MFKVELEPPYKDIGIIFVGNYETLQQAQEEGRKALGGAVGRVLITELEGAAS